MCRSGVVPEPERGGPLSQLAIIKFIQSFSTPTLDGIFGVITSLGSEGVYVLLLPLVFWIVDKPRGFRLGILFLASMCVNSGLKDYFHVPRPAESSGIRVLLGESGTGFSFPSGHAQGAMTVWGFLASRFGGGALTAAAVVIPLLVSLSRLYLGLHYLQDVAAGLGLGLVLLWVFNRIDKLVSEPPTGGTGLFSSFPVKLAAVALLPWAALSIYRSEDAFKLAGYAVGFALGYMIETGTMNVSFRASAGKQLLKLVLGYAVFFALKEFSRPLFPDGPMQLARYGLLGLWIALAAPLVFRLLRLEDRHRGIFGPGFRLLQ